MLKHVIYFKKMLLDIKSKNVCKIYKAIKYYSQCTHSIFFLKANQRNKQNPPYAKERRYDRKGAKYLFISSQKVVLFKGIKKS